MPEIGRPEFRNPDMLQVAGQYGEAHLFGEFARGRLARIRVGVLTFAAWKPQLAEVIGDFEASSHVGMALADHDDGDCLFHGTARRRSYFGEAGFRLHLLKAACREATFRHEKSRAYQGREARQGLSSP